MRSIGTTNPESIKTTQVVRRSIIGPFECKFIFLLNFISLWSDLNYRIFSDSSENTVGLRDCLILNSHSNFNSNSQYNPIQTNFIYWYFHFVMRSSEFFKCLSIHQSRISKQFMFYSGLILFNALVSIAKSESRHQSQWTMTTLVYPVIWGIRFVLWIILIWN